MSDRCIDFDLHTLTIIENNMRFMLGEKLMADSIATYYTKLNGKSRCISYVNVDAHNYSHIESILSSFITNIFHAIDNPNKYLSVKVIARWNDPDALVGELFINTKSGECTLIDI